MINLLLMIMILRLRNRMSDDSLADAWELVTGMMHIFARKLMIRTCFWRDLSTKIDVDLIIVPGPVCIRVCIASLSVKVGICKKVFALSSETF